MSGTRSMTNVENGATVMSDEIDRDFSGPDNAKAEIRAAVGY